MECVHTKKLGQRKIHSLFLITAGSQRCAIPIKDLAWSPDGHVQYTLLSRP